MGIMSIFLVFERIVLRLYIVVILINLIVVWKRGIIKREYDWVNFFF